MQTIQELVKSAVQTATKGPTTRSTPTTTRLLSEAAEVFPKFQTLGDPQLEAMLIEADRFVEDMRRNLEPRWITFLGRSGTGKTHLSGMIFEAARRIPALRKSRELLSPVRSVFWPSLLTDLRDQKYWMVSELRQCNFVMLDELSLEHDPSGFAGDRLSELLAGRIGAWTVLTSNLRLGAIAEIDERISSRMIRGKNIVVETTTKDFWLR